MDNLQHNGTARKKTSLLSLFRDTLHELTQIPHTVLRSFSATAGATGLFTHLHNVNHIDMHAVPYAIGAIFGAMTFMGHYTKEKMHTQERDIRPEHDWRNLRNHAAQYTVTGLTVTCGALGAGLGVVPETIIPVLEQFSQYIGVMPFHLNMRNITTDSVGLGMAGLLLHEMAHLSQAKKYAQKLQELHSKRFAPIDLIGREFKA